MEREAAVSDQVDTIISFWIRVRKSTNLQKRRTFVQASLEWSDNDSFHFKLPCNLSDLREEAVRDVETLRESTRSEEIVGRENVM